ncbi:MAG: V-type ATP synthase subunit I [Clostridia bacterium]|nr:V-type ATP synthase subunit I [Clostridia bacterium]
MSVSKMKRLALFVGRDEVDLLTKKLIRLRCVEIRTAEPETGDEYATARYAAETKRGQAEERVGRIHAAMEALNPYATRSRGLFGGKRKIDPDRFLSDGSAEQAEQIVEETLQILERKTEIKGELARLRANADASAPYLAYDLPLGFEGTEKTELLLGSLPIGIRMDEMGKELYEKGAVIEQLSSNESGSYVAVFCCKNDASSVGTVLSEYGFVRATFKGVSETAAEQRELLEKQGGSLEKEQEMLDGRMVELATRLDTVEEYYDIEATALLAASEQEKMLATERTVILHGWIPAEEEGRLSDLLERFDCAYELSDPEEGDNPPVLLKNNGFAANFEWVLAMYSYPAYGRFDPTFIMSIFYFIIFGIMFADAGYGLILTLGCFLGVKLLKPSRSMERFLKMFGYCGISCIVFGVLFGAYFGDLPLAIMKNMMNLTDAELPNLALLGSAAPNLAILFDPLQNPMGFLVVSLAIGAVHLIAGMAVRFVILCKEGHVWDAVFDIGAYWLLFAGVALIVLIPSVGIWVTVAAVALIVLTHGRAEKNIVMKLMKGLLGIYDLINYVSDLLSYSRILALGLAAGVIAQVVNILGTMGGASIVGFIGLVVAFCVGHLLNIAINVLGTFVHTSRLQYIEFFNKFYEDGGVIFEPAVPSEKYTEE